MAALLRRLLQEEAHGHEEFNGATGNKTQGGSHSGQEIRSHTAREVERRAASEAGRRSHRSNGVTSEVPRYDASDVD